MTLAEAAIRITELEIKVANLETAIMFHSQVLANMRSVPDLKEKIQAIAKELKP